MEFLWAFLNTLQLIHYIPMMNLHFPAHARIMFGYVGIANADNPVLASMFGTFYDETKFYDDAAFNERFER